MSEQPTQQAPKSEPVAQQPIASGPDRYSKFITGLVISVVLIVVALALLAIFRPSIFTAVINGFWIFMFSVVLIFLILGILVMVGMKNQVKQIIDIFVEGTLTLVDFLNFLKSVGKYIVDLLKEVVYQIVPIIAFLLGAVIYFSLIYVYKLVGKDNDVALFTVILTVILTTAVGFLNSRSADEGKSDLTWFRKLQLRFKDYFGDAIEVTIFVFFLTMDSTNLFFLPKELNVELHAMYGDYNFMVRGWKLDPQLGQTINIVMVAVGVEILRYLIRIIVAGLAFYRDINGYIGDSNQQMHGSDQVKWAIRQSFQVHSGDTVRFVTYTTFLIFVFLAFPRLKILAMAVTSVTMLVLDFVLQNRLVIKRGNDLFTKIVSFVFGL